MPYFKGTSTDYADLVTQILAWAADTSIHGADAWPTIRNEGWPRGAIMRAHGWEEGEHFYIGLMPSVMIKGTSYRDWLFSEKNLTSLFALSIRGLAIKPENYEFTYSPGGTISVIARNEKGQIVKSAPYTLLSPELFSQSSQAIFLGVFKQYSEGLDWHEQPGGQRPLAKPLPLRYGNGTSVGTIDPPLYPGVGFPAIGMDFSGPMSYLKFWVKKDRHRMILVTLNGDYWDVAYLGFMEPYHKPTEYAFPAAVVGGTSGVCPCGRLVDKYYEMGYLFDYSPRNWSLSHGLPTHAATPGNGNTDILNNYSLSQAQIMLPDGTWQSFANWAIQEEATVENKIYYFVHKEPEPAAIKHYIRPTFTDASQTGHIYQGDVIDTVTYQLEPIEFVQATSTRNNMLGRLSGIYWPSAPVWRYGEQMINGKHHLVVPSGWEGRKWHIPHGRTGITDHDALYTLDKRIGDLSKTMNCVIRLED